VRKRARWRRAHRGWRFQNVALTEGATIDDLAIRVRIDRKGRVSTDLEPPRLVIRYD
jgi:hypothetical protein